MKDFNFLPKSYKENLRRKKSNQWIRKIIIPYVTVMVILLVVPFGINFKLNRDRTKALNEITQEDYFARKRTQLQLVQDVYIQREEQAVTLSNYGMDASTILEDLEEIMPDNLYIEYLNIVQNSNTMFQLGMKCVATTKEDAATFLELLRESPNYYSASISGFDEAEGSNSIKFTLSCTYRILA